MNRFSKTQIYLHWITLLFVAITYAAMELRGWWICPYISRHLLSLNPLQARCRRYSRGER
ncbi:outer membrane pore protein [Shigella dysenteriae]|uniref:Outer membrane pore protein n=1 Tax=Shigella dysenteriae TaxID=622 RepID=A0A3P6M4T4_SHIDY|nr:outer membrane pore protein [Shigella dysenteriae]